ncbi:MAG: type II toxin-antitoxin system HicA family toxin [Chloroflexi bacterium]|nr:type II toxin-antitoxin system HicA family toxin [Chloroflexota bacterium]
MKRRDMIAYLESQGCRPEREGAKHTWYVNQLTGEHAAVPRHREIRDFLVKKICRELKIRPP